MDEHGQLLEGPLASLEPVPAHLADLGQEIRLLAVASERAVASPPAAVLHLHVGASLLQQFLGSSAVPVAAERCAELAAPGLLEACLESMR